ncbi:hypothetical protein PI124_g10318 [Phytophthora idaei]|nr:hypothetical protein PI125_g9905 [Phytophthora idaei]KAG3164760.1 hypothetical protein PI126_g4970 [Phytophthora idaei]KAG3244922.1 hypothetical protein PI124_g10318 [Phytophthora idaei]
MCKVFVCPVTCRQMERTIGPLTENRRESLTSTELNVTEQDRLIVLLEDIVVKNKPEWTAWNRQVE